MPRQRADGERATHMYPADLALAESGQKLFDADDRALNYWVAKAAIERGLPWYVCLEMHSQADRVFQVKRLQRLREPLCDGKTRRLAGCGRPFTGPIERRPLPCTR